jgi:hypothetical protein
MPRLVVNMNKQEKLLLTEKAQAELLSISWRGLAEYRKRRLVPCVRLGRLVRYNPVEVARAMEALTVESVGTR